MLELNRSMEQEFWDRGAYILALNGDRDTVIGCATIMSLEGKGIWILWNSIGGGRLRVFSDDLQGRLLRKNGNCFYAQKVLKAMRKFMLLDDLANV